MTAAHPHDAQIRALYASFLDGWNRQSGAAVAAGFADDGDIIGFDGTHHRGRLSIAADLRAVFGSHQTPAYVAVVRSVHHPDVNHLTATHHLLTGRTAIGCSRVSWISSVSWKITLRLLACRCWG